MIPFIIVRSYRPQDEINCQSLIKSYILSFVNKAFLFCLFKEITVQFIVITWAILFIFFGVPLLFCALSIPGCIVFMYFCVYTSIYCKAIEILNMRPNQCIVAELYEPYLFFRNANDTMYEIYLDEEPYDETYKAKFRRKIVGTIDIKNHNSMHNACWIYRFGISPQYPFTTVAEPLIKHMLNICYQQGRNSVELVTTEWQQDERDLLTKMGFITRQIYHKQILGFTLMKCHLGYELFERINDTQEIPAQFQTKME